MKPLYITLFLTSVIFSAQSQINTMEYEPSEKHPYGRLNPDAPASTADFEDIIGTCDCKSISRNPDGSWADTLNMVWKFKYIMNGFAVQDEVWRENGLYAGSIRQYQPDSAKWVVTYFSYPAVPMSPGVWHGNKDGNDIVLYMDQTAPNGMDGKSKLTFYNINSSGFSWKGEWVDTAETFSYPIWNIYCDKRL